jgi:hypothetical protein
MTGRCSAIFVVLAVSMGGCDIQRGDETAPPPRREEPAAPGAAAPAPAPPVRRSLEGDPASAEALPVDSLPRIDLAATASSGELTIEVNEPFAQPAAPALIDGSVDSLLKTDGTNPLVVTLTFRQPIQLQAARVFLAASPHDWVIEPLPGEQRLLATNVPEREWSQISLPEPLETNVVRIEILRLERDDYVHANEIELYGPAR